MLDVIGFHSLCWFGNQTILPM